MFYQRLSINRQGKRQGTIECGDRVRYRGRPVYFIGGYSIPGRSGRTWLLEDEATGHIIGLSRTPSEVLTMIDTERDGNQLCLF